MSAPDILAAIDRTAFRADVDALHAELKADLGEPDLAHLRKMVRWGRICSIAGYALAWPMVNPLAAILIGMGNVGRWASVTHPVMHRGYDAVPGVPERYRSRNFAIGWRRYLDWLDWLHPDAWAHEHNQLHHYHTGQRDDPDLVERNAWIIRLQAMPRVAKWLLVALLMMTWKLTYYAPNTFWALKQQRRIKAQTADEAKAASLPTPGTAWRLVVPGERLVLPVTPWGVEFYLRVLREYGVGLQGSKTENVPSTHSSLILTIFG